MCLGMLTKKAVSKGEKTYYKVVISNTDGDTFRSSIQDTVLCYGENTDLSKKKITVRGDMAYDSGFHFFTCKKNAKMWCAAWETIVKITVPNGEVIQWGEQDISSNFTVLTAKVGVAQRIIIHKDEMKGEN